MGTNQGGFGFSPPGWSHRRAPSKTLTPTASGDRPDGVERSQNSCGCGQAIQDSSRHRLAVAGAVAALQGRLCQIALKELCQIIMKVTVNSFSPRAEKGTL